MNKPDLNEIPERFHILFNSDWNNGSNSSMKLDERMNCQELFLEYNKWRIKQAIIKTTSTNEDDIVQGFIND